MPTPGTLEAVLLATGYNAAAEATRHSLQQVVESTMPESVRKAAENELAVIPAHTASRAEAVKLLRQALAQFEGAQAADADATAPAEEAHTRLTKAQAIQLDADILSQLTHAVSGYSATELTQKAGKKRIQVDNRIRKLLAAGKIKQVQGTGTAGKGNPSRFILV